MIDDTQFLNELKWSQYFVDYRNVVDGFSIKNGMKDTFVHKEDCILVPEYHPIRSYLSARHILPWSSRNSYEVVQVMLPCRGFFEWAQDSNVHFVIHCLWADGAAVALLKAEDQVMVRLAWPNISV